MAEPSADDRLRFHLDEAVDPDVASALAKHGIDVTTTSQARLRTEPDTAHFAYARRTGRVIVTHDADFLRFAGRTTDHPGIAYCAPATRSMGEIIERLILVYEVLRAGDMRGRVEFL